MAAQMSDKEPEIEAARCLLCKRLLDQPDDPLSKDCGGDCLGCMQSIEAEMAPRPICEACGCEIDEGVYEVNGKTLCQSCHFAEPGVIDEIESVLPLDAAPPPGWGVSPRPDAPVRRKVEKPLKLTAIKITNFNKTFDPPDRNTVQHRLDQMIEQVQGDLPLTLRLKRVTGLSDEEIGVFVNRSRATIQAYAQDNRREILDAEQIKVLRSVLHLRRDMIDDLLIELEAMTDVL